MVLDSLLSGHRWVYTMHVFVGPFLSLIAYLAYSLHFQGKFKEYSSFIEGLLIAQMVIGIAVALYHANNLAKNNNLY